MNRILFFALVAAGCGDRKGEPRGSAPSVVASSPPQKVDASQVNTLELKATQPYAIPQVYSVLINFDSGEVSHKVTGPEYNLDEVVVIRSGKLESAELERVVGSLAKTLQHVGDSAGCVTTDHAEGSSWIKTTTASGTQIHDCTAAGAKFAQPVLGALSTVMRERVFLEHSEVPAAARINPEELVSVSITSMEAERGLSESTTLNVDFETGALNYTSTTEVLAMGPEDVYDIVEQSELSAKGAMNSTERKTLAGALAAAITSANINVECHHASDYPQVEVRYVTTGGKYTIACDGSAPEELEETLISVLDLVQNEQQRYSTKQTTTEE